MGTPGVGITNKITHQKFHDTWTNDPALKIGFTPEKPAIDSSSPDYGKVKKLLVGAGLLPKGPVTDTQVTAAVTELQKGLVNCKDANGKSFLADGDVDGKWTAKTQAAVLSFRTDRTAASKSTGDAQARTSFSPNQTAKVALTTPPSASQSPTPDSIPIYGGTGSTPSTPSAASGTFGFNQAATTEDQVKGIALAGAKIALENNPTFGPAVRAAEGIAGLLGILGAKDAKSAEYTSALTDATKSAKDAGLLDGSPPFTKLTLKTLPDGTSQVYAAGGDPTNPSDVPGYPEPKPIGTPLGKGFKPQDLKNVVDAAVSAKTAAAANTPENAQSIVDACNQKLAQSQFPGLSVGIDPQADAQGNHSVNLINPNGQQLPLFKLGANGSVADLAKGLETELPKAFQKALLQMQAQNNRPAGPV